MTFTSRRAVLGGLAFAATGLASSRTSALMKDGGAAGYSVNMRRARSSRRPSTNCENDVPSPAKSFRM
jgi:hypothetical protein